MGCSRRFHLADISVSAEDKLLPESIKYLIMENLITPTFHRMMGSAAAEYFLEATYYEGGMDSFLLISLFFNSPSPELVATWKTEAKRSTQRWPYHYHKMFRNPGSVLKKLRPVDETILMPFERTPTSCQIKPAAQQVAAGRRVDVSIHDIQDSSGGRSREFNRLVVQAVEGQIIGGTSLDIDPVLKAFMVGAGQIKFQYIAPADFQEGADTISVYNSCDILPQNLLLLSKTSLNDKIAEVEILISASARKKAGNAQPASIQPWPSEKGLAEQGKMLQPPLSSRLARWVNRHANLSILFNTSSNAEVQRALTAPESSALSLSQSIPSAVGWDHPAVPPGAQPSVESLAVSPPPVPSVPGDPPAKPPAQNYLPLQPPIQRISPPQSLTLAAENLPQTARALPASAGDLSSSGTSDREWRRLRTIFNRHAKKAEEEQKHSQVPSNLPPAESSTDRSLPVQKQEDLSLVTPSEISAAESLLPAPAEAERPIEGSPGFSSIEGEPPLPRPEKNVPSEPVAPLALEPMAGKTPVPVQTAATREEPSTRPIQTPARMAEETIPAKKGIISLEPEETQAPSTMPLHQASAWQVQRLEAPGFAEKTEVPLPVPKEPDLSKPEGKAEERLAESLNVEGLAENVLPASSPRSDRVVLAEVLPPSKPRPGRLKKDLSSSKPPCGEVVQRQSGISVVPPPEAEMVATPIGPLPDDLWTLLGQPKSTGSALDFTSEAPLTRLEGKSAELSPSRSSLAMTQQIGTPAPIQRFASAVEIPAPEPPPETSAAAQPESSPLSDADIEELSRQVYTHLRRRLMVEREQGRSRT
jgi:hypothetical protein